MKRMTCLIVLEDYQALAREAARAVARKLLEKPDLVLVLLGANDAIYTFTDKRVKHTMSILIDELLRTTDADILLLGPSPIADKPGIPERYGKIYREIAEEKGIAYFDLAPVFSALADEDYRRAFI